MDPRHIEEPDTFTYCEIVEHLEMYGLRSKYLDMSKFYGLRLV